MRSTTLLLGLFLALAVLSIVQRATAEVDGGIDVSFFIPSGHDTATNEDVYDLLRYARALRDEGTKSDGASKAVASAIAAAVATLPPTQLSHTNHNLQQVPERARAYLPAAIDLLARIRSFAIAPPCLDRPGIPSTTAGPYKYLIAANLVNCGGIMPYWILEVLRLGLLLSGNSMVLAGLSQNVANAQSSASADGYLPHISVYESGSEDNTVPWLLVAEQLWGAAGMRTFVVVNGSLTRQMVTDPFSGKYQEQRPVQFSASVRNAALEPLYGAPPGTYDKIFFVNDVFFCAADLFRLTHLKADIACGLDFEVLVGRKIVRMSHSTVRKAGWGRRRRRLQSLSGATTDNATGAAADARNGNLTLRASLNRMSNVHFGEFVRQMAAEGRIRSAPVQLRYEFHDTWVSRDISGKPFGKDVPFISDKRTRGILSKGMPVPVKCCWNGAADVNAAPLVNGLRFRSGLINDGECDSSECSLLCQDYRRVGATRVVVDPSVRVAYVPWSKSFHGSLSVGVGPRVPWSQVQRSGALQELEAIWNDTKSDMATDCIPLGKGSVEPLPVDLAPVNYTQMFLEDRRQPSQQPTVPRPCNLLMGPYGAVNEGTAFDDLQFAAMGEKPITGLTYTTGFMELHSLQFTYGSGSENVTAEMHGQPAGDRFSVIFQPGEHITNVVVYYDGFAVIKLLLSTNRGRRTAISGLMYRDKYGWPGSHQAVATPYPSDPAARADRFRLAAIGGTSDNCLRSISFLWTEISGEV
ncbi:hypothetical protein Agub_g3805 [Astrephomene gubernaculifera]|uniref:Jacalin-type lectin domain-containing protein n=1 Tax=Astrephomene gubernaculifera TaxID=47775 RepID=A0AAD3HJ92_9CHLO|nr:hypothetical protein Agub_g3805 [Astrephomene gubernaculifera]